VATFPDLGGGGWEELFKAADEALYVSKRSGRNQSNVWTPAARNSGGPTSAKGSAKAQPAA
jgi:hypothetical protein